jgi:predicted nuclease of predicted toxin-antitoxin system
MTIQILVDMNLSPDWVPCLESHGWKTVHWSTVGDFKAKDQDIMAWAIQNNFVVFTHDLDFGTALALTRAMGPSVFQIRAEDVLLDNLQGIVLAALKQHQEDLALGALVVVDAAKSRVRVLPIS